MDAAQRKTIDLPFAPGTQPVYDRTSMLYWPPAESVDRCWKYMLDRVCDVDLLVQNTRTKGVVVQAGGFVGMWPLRLTKFFERVYTFEPVSEVFQALQMNTRMNPAIIAENCALSSHSNGLEIGYHRSGCSRHEPGGPLRRTTTIDSIGLVRCDAIYLDVEKHELDALAGAAQTIEKFHPAIMLETHPDMMLEQNNYMRKLGYRMQAKVHSDRVFTWGQH